VSRDEKAAIAEALRGKGFEVLTGKGGGFFVRGAGPTPFKTQHMTLGQARKLAEVNMAQPRVARGRVSSYGDLATVEMISRATARPTNMTPEGHQPQRDIPRHAKGTSGGRGGEFKPK
jgi:hypothetical protein